MSGNRKSRLAYVNGLKSEIANLKSQVMYLEQQAKKHDVQLLHANEKRSAKLDATLAQMMQVRYEGDDLRGYVVQVSIPTCLRTLSDLHSVGMEYAARMVADRVRHEIETLRFPAEALENERKRALEMRQRYERELVHQKAMRK